MNTVSEWFKGLRSRFSNPIFFNFLIAWFIINWRIPLGILKYDLQDLKVDGYNSYFELIQRNSSYLEMFYYPLLISIGYTLINPFVKILLTALNTWVNTWGNNWHLRIGRTSNVPIGRYQKLFDDLQNREHDLEKLIKTESKLMEENDSLKRNVEDVKKEKNSLVELIQDWTKYSKVEYLNGRHQMTYSSGGDIVTNNVEISRGEIFLRKGGRNSDLLFRVENFSFNIVTSEFLFRAIDERNDRRPYLVNLKAPNMHLGVLSNLSNDTIITELIRQV